MSRRTYFAELTDAPVEDPAGFALPPVRSVVLDRAEALEEDAREADLARLLPVASWSSTLPNYHDGTVTDILDEARALEAAMDAQAVVPSPERVAMLLQPTLARGRG